ncbi:hypothetical protein BLM37_00360 [Candidatus Gracilibacteria bacterium GN02-873]|nr:hypothetical protein BLM37_00360 [Candidatus Gracilibacteria bacterium GN02-873]
MINALFSNPFLKGFFDGNFGFVKNKISREMILLFANYGNIFLKNLHVQKSCPGENHIISFYSRKNCPEWQGKNPGRSDFLQITSLLECLTEI